MTQLELDLDPKKKKYQVFILEGDIQEDECEVCGAVEWDYALTEDGHVTTCCGTREVPCTHGNNGDECADCVRLKYPEDPFL